MSQQEKNNQEDKISIGMNNEELYKENILEHNRHPHNKKKLPSASFTEKASNPSCGDTLEMELLIGKDDKIIDVGFSGEGCAISQASSSMVTDKIKGMSIDGLRLFSPGDVYNLLGIHISPSRSQCALLPYQALTAIIKKLPHHA